jgi:hypothetical protein
MQDVKMTGYHTCRDDGDREMTLENAPFLCNPSKRQWLSQGYYFWTDNDFFAHEWGKNSYNNQYCIAKCAIEISRDRLLDLVGSVSDQLWFKEKLEELGRFFKANRITKSPSVAACIGLMRNKPGFEFLAIKAQDLPPQHGQAPFTAESRECMPLVTRQQLCVFQQGLSCILSKELIYPE